MDRRIGGFDILKLMGTILIVFHHYQQITGAFWENGINFWGGDFYFGYLVELFFMISGFLAFKYIERIRYGMGFIDYVKGKFIRFFPLMFLCVIASTILSHLYIILYENTFWRADSYSLWTILVASVGIQAGWGIKDPMINSPTWYISVLFLCLILLYCIVRISEKLHVSVNYLFVGMILIGIGIDYYLIDLPFLNRDTCRGYVAFFAGTIIADIVIRSRNRKKGNKGVIISALVAFIIPFLIYKHYWLVQKDVRYIMTFIYYPALIWLCTSKRLILILDCKLTEIVGEISYSVFMWHFPMIIAMYVFKEMFNFYINIYSVQTMILFTAVCFCVGIISLNFIEKPINKIIKARIRKGVYYD